MHIGLTVLTLIVIGLVVFSLWAIITGLISIVRDKDAAKGTPAIIFGSAVMLFPVIFGIPDLYRSWKNVLSDTHVYDRTNGTKLIIEGKLITSTRARTIFQLRDGKYIVTNFVPYSIRLHDWEKIIQVWTCEEEIKLPGEETEWVELFNELNKINPRIQTARDTVVR